MKPFTTLKRDMKVIVYRKTSSSLSTVEQCDIDKMFTITGFDWEGRRHNYYISYVYLKTKGREIRASINEIAGCNPNFEPEGNFIICVGCGATVTDSDLKRLPRLNGIVACPSCGMLEPTSS